jgi:hypothetical protein
MHRNDKVPAEHRGRIASAKWLADNWKEMSEEERAKFEGVKEQLRNRGPAEYRDHAAVSKKIFRRLTWTIGLAESVGIEMVGYVVDQRYERGTRYFGTAQGIRFNTIGSLHVPKRPNWTSTISTKS